MSSQDGKFDNFSKDTTAWLLRSLFAMWLIGYVLRFMRHAPLKILHSYGDITIVSEGQQR